MEGKGLFYDFKVHLICIILVVIAELIGIISISLGPIKFSLLPMLHALVIGILLSQIRFLKILNQEDMETASPYIGICVMYLIAYMGSTIGPNLSLVASAGPALILQELGNLGTIFFSMPIAVLIFKMDRTCIGSAFSNSREGSLAIIADLYGLDSPEGRGVMGSYITGTLLGTIFNGILASLLVNVSWFLPEALAAACGTGSASMMSAALGPILEAFPEKADSLTAFAATSQVLTSIDGMYMSLFIAIPLTEWLYKKLKGKKAIEEEKQAKIKEETKQIPQDVAVEEATITTKDEWITRIKVLIFSGVFCLIANWLNSIKSGNSVTPFEALPGMLWLFAIIIVGNILKDFLDKYKINLPTIVYITLLATILSIPNLWPGAKIMNASLEKISLLPLCTPILAYAGIATGKDMAAFKEQGFKIIIVTLCALAGTYIGSAVIANVVLKITGGY